jgi:hypothetical protein
VSLDEEARAKELAEAYLAGMAVEREAASDALERIAIALERWVDAQLGPEVWDE